MRMTMPWPICHAAPHARTRQPIARQGPAPHRPARCTGCGWCVAVCPPHVLALQVQGPQPWGPKRSVLHDAPGCTGCALCDVRCPFDAIRMERRRTPG